MWPITVTAVIFAPIGALVTPYISKPILIVFFAVLVLMVTVKVFYDLNKAKKKPKMAATTNSVSIEIAANSEEKVYTFRQRQVIGGTEDAGIGLIGGLLGVGGGFIIANPDDAWL